MNANEFTKAFSRAYLNRHEVMGNPVVVYNPTEDCYYSKSSMTPLRNGEVVLATIEDGMFGPEATTQEEIEHYIDFFYLSDGEAMYEIESKIEQAVRGQ